MQLHVLTSLLLFPFLSFALPFNLDSVLHSSHPLATRQSIQSITDTLLFTNTITQFITARNKKQPSNLIWDSDGCTSSPDEPLGFNFKPSCYRHDFGYRNYKAQNRFSTANKNKIDSNFKKDMYNQCAKEKKIEQAACKGVADLYYEAVQEFANKKRSESIDIGF